MRGGRAAPSVSSPTSRRSLTGAEPRIEQVSRYTIGAGCSPPLRMRAFVVFADLGTSVVLNSIEPIADGPRLRASLVSSV